MTDIASLGLSIDSSPAEKLATDLNKVSQAGKAAEAGVKSFEQSATKAGAATAGLSKNIQATLNSVEAVNRRLNVRDSFGGAERAADIAAYGQELDKLRARYNPLFAVQQNYRAQVDDISKAAKVGALSEDEKSVALLRAEQAYKNQTKAISLNEQQVLKSGKAALVSGYQMQNLAFQVNDVATMAAMGMDPLRIFTSQAGQIYQVLSMTEGGSRAALREIGSMFLGLITPVTAAATAVVAFGAAATAATIGWRSAQREIRAALLGVGGAAGMTADDINAISFAANEAGQTTVGNARAMAIEFARTGKINKEITVELIGLGRDLAAVYGEEITEAAERMARAVADPAKGVEELNKRLGAFDDRTLQNIKSLAAHGDRLAAQRLLVDGLKESINGAANSTSFWARTWNNVSQSASGWWAGLGERIDRAMGGGTLRQQIEEAQSLIKSYRENDIYGTLGSYIAREEARLKSLNEQLQLVTENARKADVNLRAMSAVDLAQRASPDLSQRTALEADLSTLRRAIADQELLGSLSDANRETMTRAVQVLQTKVRWHKTDFEISMEQNQFEQRSLAARTVAEKAQLAFEQTSSQLRRQGLTEVEALVLATMARNKVLKEGEEETKKAIRERTFEQERSLSQIELETSLIGKTTAQAAGLRAQWEAISEAKRRAFDAGTSVTEGDLRNAASYGGSVRAATMGQEGAQLSQEQKTPSQQFADEMARLNELRGADAISWQTYYAAKSQAELNSFNQTQQLLEAERGMRTTTVTMAAGLLQQLGTKSRAAAIAAILLNKALAAATIIQDTARASMAAAASAAVGGPAAAAAAAASMQALGAIQLGIVAATGALEVKNAMKGSGSASSRNGGRSSSSASYQESMTNQSTGTLTQSVSIQLVGSRYTREEVRELIEEVNRTVRDGTVLNVSYG